MQSPLAELEHFRVLLKYFGAWTASNPVLARGILQLRFSGPTSSLLVPTRFRSRQAHSFLHLALDRDAAQACAFSAFPSREARYRPESAAPLNPFISTENRIIWLTCPPPSSA